MHITKLGKIILLIISTLHLSLNILQYLEMYFICALFAVLKLSDLIMR